MMVCCCVVAAAAAAASAVPPGSGTIDFNEFLDMMTSKMSERDSREEILKAFRLFDDDETGKITLKNLRRVAKEIGENMTDEELQEMIEEADLDGDNEIDQEEFLRIMKKTSSVMRNVHTLAYSPACQPGRLAIVCPLSVV